MSGLDKHIHDLAVPPILDQKGKWIFCRNAKVASTSISEGPLRKRSLIHRRSIELWEAFWKAQFEHRLDETLLFTFVRNPWDRLVSAFFHCRDKAKTPVYQIDKTWEFQPYVKQVLAVEGTGINRHFAPQYETVCFEGKPIPGMFVGRFERLQDDWNKLARRLRVSKRLPKRNAGRMNGKYSEYYDDETREIVGRMYQREIEFLGYEF